MKKTSIPSKNNNKGATTHPHTIHEQTGFCVRNQQNGFKILNENEVQMYIHGRALTNLDSATDELGHISPFLVLMGPTRSESTRQPNSYVARVRLILDISSAYGKKCVVEVRLYSK